jgi:hypothetical protein
MNGWMKMAGEAGWIAKQDSFTHINKQVLPQAPSPTMTSFRRISAMVSVCV